MTTLLEDSKALRSRLRAEVPAGDALDEALAALDRVDAVCRLVAIEDEKATIEALAKTSADAMRPIEKRAWLELAKAQAIAVVERDAEAAAALEAEAAAVEVVVDAPVSKP